MSAEHSPLGDAQVRLVASLTGDASASPAMDAARLAAMAAVLLDKRRRAVAKRFPGLVRVLGAEFRARFDEYARITRPASVDEDALRFIGNIGASRSLPRDLRMLRRRLWLRVRLTKMRRA